MIKLTENKLYTFEDLEFKPKKSGYNTNLQARIDFPNGYGVSVLTPDKTGRHKYCQADKGFYELALMDNGSYRYGRIVEDSDMVDDGYDYDGVWIDCTKEKVEELMNKIQNLSKDE